MQALATTTTDNGIRAAIRALEQSAALGHPPAQLQLGEMYKSGDSVTKDLDQARVWYERAAAGGNVLAMHRLGVMAARGEGGPVEPARSIEWFEQAANLGLVDAQFNLGTTYHPSADGATVFQDREKAFYWYSLAAKNGDSQAGELAAGVGAALAPEKRAELLAEVDLWEPLPVNDEANERAAV
jgi:localization factor PodJL